ncbi:MAG: ankyrin repeat domain-containing protein [Fibrobacterales bacterium]
MKATMKLPILILSILFLLLVSQPLFAENSHSEIKERYKIYILIKKGKTAEALAYITNHPQINNLTYKGRTPLIWAIQNQQPEIVEALAKTGVNVTAHYRGIPPLLFALIREHYKSAKALIDHNIALWEYDKSGTTPLMHALTENRNVLAANILSRDISGIQLNDNTGRSALDWALINKNNAQVALLLKHGAQIDPTSKTHYWFNYLKRGSIPLIKKLLEPVPSVNIIAQSGETPLTLAAKIGNIPLAKILIAKKADLNKPNHYDKYPLTISINGQHRRFSALLIESGANVNVQDSEGWTPLMLSSAHSFMSLVEQILKKGPEINLQDNTGKTALQFACMNGSPAITKKILAHGASPSISDNDGNDCKEIAIEMGHAEIVQLLRSSGHN